MNMKSDIRHCYKHGDYSGYSCPGCDAEHYLEEQRRWQECLRRMEAERRRMTDVGFFLGFR